MHSSCTFQLITTCLTLRDMLLLKGFHMLVQGLFDNLFYFYFSFIFTRAVFVLVFDLIFFFSCNFYYYFFLRAAKMNVLIGII